MTHHKISVTIVVARSYRCMGRATARGIGRHVNEIGFGEGDDAGRLEDLLHVLGIEAGEKVRNHLSTRVSELKTMVEQLHPETPPAPLRGAGGV